jgi:hypothetical protein
MTIIISDLIRIVTGKTTTVNSLAKTLPRTINYSIFNHRPAVGDPGQAIYGFAKKKTK